MIPGVNCTSCSFWELLAGMGRADNRLGNCRAHAPILAPSLEGKFRSKFPITCESDWCGDHAVAVESADG